MTDLHSDPGRQLSKFIATLARQWKEELGSPEAEATGIVLKQAHRLLSEIHTEQTTAARLGPGVPASWLEINPWACQYVQRIDRILDATETVASR